MITMILVGLCFFLSMLIANDVALITFVPFTIVTLKQMGEGMENKHLVRIVVMQTIVANLGTFVALFIFIGNLGLCNVFVQIHYTSESPVRFLFYEKVLSGIHGVQ